MSSAHERKKQPATVRRSLLEHGARLCLEEGVAGFTLQSVAEAAGVTKGGLLHHFGTKQELVDAIFDGLLQSFEASIERAMAEDRQAHGRFTRAYVRATLELVDEERFSPWAALTMSMITEAGLRRRWSEWLRHQLKRHRATDSAPELKIARLAADGLWLANLVEEAGVKAETRSALGARLIAMTEKSTP